MLFHLVGNGQSEGDRVHVEDIDTYVQDVIAHIELMRKKYPALPCILLGHSMVGLCSVCSVIKMSGDKLNLQIGM